MLRIDTINKLIFDYCKALSRQQIMDNPAAGISAVDIAKNLNILRNNASSDLNRLHAEGKLIKIKGKPTKYFDRKIFEELFDMTLMDDLVECDSLTDIVKPNKAEKDGNYDPFDKLIGFNQSLSSIIKLAKASILYPNGLHTLLLGESGVGKSLFAELMYEYGMSENVFKNDSSFVVFNCADYANNPNLLLSQLFGSAKGSYTGADSSKEGLIEKADGGILFLDEIHRLPPEGQEMLFLFIDKKKFRRLGEVSNNRTANVLIIAATTENPSSSLLTTFIRRIPVIIKIPNLKERSLNEKLDIISNFYNIEAKKINKRIVIDKKTLMDLIVYNPPGNIGQLNSDIQLSIARAYLDSKLGNYDYVKVNEEFLPYYTTTGTLNLDISTRKKVELLLNENEYTFFPDSTVSINDSTPKYDFIKFYTKKLQENGDSKIDIQKIFEDYTQIIAKNIALSNNYPAFIDEELKEIVSTLSDILFQELNLVIDKSSYIALALYLKNLKENNCEVFNTNKYIKLTDIPSNIYIVAQNLIKTLERNFKIYCPSSEISTLAIIINSLKSKEIFEPVGIIVAAHGDSLASNVASVVNTLLGINHVLSVDMPLTHSPEKTLEILLNSINSSRNYSGILLFVDMGSLTNLEPILKEKTGINVVTLESTNVLLVLEATRKAIFLKKDINDILSDLIGLNIKLSNSFNRKIEKHLSINKKRIIYTVCFSGEGVAFYLEKTLHDLFNEYNIFDIEIIPFSIKNNKQLTDIINRTSMNREIIAIAGSIDPVIDDIPFITLEDILLNNGINKILSLIGINSEDKSTTIPLSTFTRNILIDVTCEAINKYLIYLSAEKVSLPISDFVSTLEKSLNISLTNSTITKLFIHISCMIERILLKENTLTPQEEFEEYIITNADLIKTIQNSIKPLEELFSIKINYNELYYITEIIKTNG